MTTWWRQCGKRVLATVAALAVALPAAPYVFAAYAVAWVAVLAYVLVLWRKQARLERELERVQAELRSGGPG